MRLLLRSTALAAAIAASPAIAQDRQVFEVPAGAGPHDVAPAPDGLVWYTAQAQGALGILDPATGTVRQVPLGANSSPHGVIQGPDGAAWITDSGQNAIVRFDPVTEAIAVFPLPPGSPSASLNTAAFDGDGILWFTGQAGIYGRLDPATGVVEVFPAPGGRGPYGIAATPDGEVYFVSLAGSYLARIDRVTHEAQLIAPPTSGSGPRRVWSDSQGRLWVAEWNAGRLSMFDPRDSRWRSFTPPGANPMIYAVYVDERDIVWISDFGASAVLSFDPRTETFTAYPMTQPGANVRQILGRPGEVWLPESATNRLVVIRW